MIKRIVIIMLPDSHDLLSSDFEDVGNVLIDNQFELQRVGDGTVPAGHLCPKIDTQQLRTDCDRVGIERIIVEYHMKCAVCGKMFWAPVSEELCFVCRGER